jgi:hypothetical protein
MTDPNDKIDRMEPLLFIAQARIAVLMQLESCSGTGRRPTANRAMKF